MTIAIGLLASDGLVVAADTQDTIPGYWKLKHGKISAAGRALMGETPRGRSLCLVAGAGQRHHLNELAGRTVRRFTSEPHLNSIDDVQPALAEVLRAFHEEYIFPYAVYPLGERPEVQLLIGCNFSIGTSGLFVSEGILLGESAPYAPLGSGAPLANTLLSRFYRVPLLDVRQTILLAIHVLYNVKESVDGCGQHTDVAGIRHGGRGFKIARKHVNAIEETMDEYCNLVDPEQLRWALGDTVEPHKKRGAIRRKLARLMEQIAV